MVTAEKMRIDNIWKYSLTSKNKTLWTTNIFEKNTNSGPQLLDNIGHMSLTRNTPLILQETKPII